MHVTIDRDKCTCPIEPRYATFHGHRPGCPAVTITGEEKMTRKYLVCRADAIKNGGTCTIQSSCFPILVTMEHIPGTEVNPADVVRKAMDQINPGYVGMHNYVVVPLDIAYTVSFRPKKDYEVEIRRY